MEENKICDVINQILTSNSVGEKVDTITKYIPEIKTMIGFEHRHPHHYLDVWGHTLVVMNGLKEEDLDVKMAGLLHDIGKPFSYQDEEVRHFHGHPEVSEKMSKQILKRLGYEEEFIEDVCYLVKMHDTVIDTKKLNCSHEMAQKLLKLQYADALAHHPDKVGKRVEFLDKIKKELDEVRDNEREL